MKVMGGQIFSALHCYVSILFNYYSDKWHILYLDLFRTELIPIGKNEQRTPSTNFTLNNDLITRCCIVM